MAGLIERQVFVTWYTPSEKLPPTSDEMVICTINGRTKNMIFKRAVVLLAWCEDGWWSPDHDFVELEVLAWCDLEPYGGVYGMDRTKR